MNGPETVAERPFPRAHEGHSGWRIDQIDGIVQQGALDVDPHIILLHIGTNDMVQMPQGASGRLETLVDRIIATKPDALLVLSNIVPLPLAEAAVEAYNPTIPGIVEERAQTGANIIFVDQFSGFPESDLDDLVHPTPAGYARMAGVWYEAIEPYLH